MNRDDIKRWTKISLRTIHLLGVTGVGGGVFLGLDKAIWLGYWWLALTSGFALMLVDAYSNRTWLVQVRGISVYIKLILLMLLGLGPRWDITLLVVIIVISSIVSHAPGKLRYYSVYHRRVIRSDTDTKG